MDPATTGHAVEQASHFWEVAAAVIGGVIGSLAGGIPAWMLAKRQSDEALRRDTQERIEIQKSLAFSVLVKLVIIVNSIIHLRNHAELCELVRQQPGHEHMQAWQVLTPLVGHAGLDLVKFEPSELAVFASAKEIDFMLDLMLFAQRHSTSVETMQEYYRRREAFVEIGPRPESFEGEMGQTMLTKEEYIATLPYTIPLNNLAESLTKNLRNDLVLARDVAAGFGTITRRYFNDPTFSTLTFPTDDELAEMIRPPAAVA